MTGNRGRKTVQVLCWTAGIGLVSGSVYCLAAAGNGGKGPASVVITAEASKPPVTATEVSEVPAAPPTPPLPQKAAEQPSDRTSSARSQASGVAKGAQSALRVERLLVTTAVEERRPRTVNGTLPADGRPVVAYLEVTNSSAAKRQVVVTFERDGSPPLGRVRLDIPVGVAHWRTWAQTTRLRTPGRWSATVRTAEGTLLRRQDFVAGSS